MSYSKTYSGSVPYSGSVSYTYHYPASENGGSGSGTVHYSGSVPVSVNLYVDTNPFDNSVNACSSSVNRLNGAVVSMNAAQVASIRKSASEVSSHVINGFFNMISSELSQNMAALLAKFKAVFELLLSKSGTLQKQQVVMQDDYSRISERYNKIFQNLDEELEKRVIALDKNVFEISKHVQGEQLYTETSKKVTQFLLGINEDEIVQQQLLIANAKARVLEAMEGLSANVIQEAAYSRKLNSVVSERNCGSGEANYIPVIFSETSNLYSDSVDYNCYSTQFLENSKNEISDAVKNYFVTNIAGNQKPDEKEAKQIDDAFKQISEREFQDLKDEKSLRVFEVLKQLKGN